MCVLYLLQLSTGYVMHYMSVMESRDLVSVSRLVFRPIFASLGLGPKGFSSHLGLGLEGYRSRNFEYCKEMVW